jgi:hypothetical protein
VRGPVEVLLSDRQALHSQQKQPWHSFCLPFPAQYLSKSIHAQSEAVVSHVQLQWQYMLHVKRKVQDAVRELKLHELNGTAGGWWAICQP